MRCRRACQVISVANDCAGCWGGGWVVGVVEVVVILGVPGDIGIVVVVEMGGGVVGVVEVVVEGVRSS